MKRIFPNQFMPSYLSMTKASLQALYLKIEAIYEDSFESRLLLTSINSLRFKVNNPTISIQNLRTLALQELQKRLGTHTPSAVPSASHKQPSLAAPSATVPSVSPKGSPTTVPSASPEGSPRSCGASNSSSTSFPHPLITGPLLHEAIHVQELYYLPLAQLHNQLFLLTYQAIKQAATLGWQGEDTKTKDRPWSSCFAPDTERAHIQQRLLKLDSQLQNFWNRYHLAIDQIQGKPISPETIAEIEKETKACNSPSLSTTVPDGSPSANKPLGSYTKTEILSGLFPPTLSLEDLILARQDRDKKLLRRRDRQKTEAHKATVQEAATELHEWGIYIEPSQAKTCEHYGFQVPQDWLRPVPTEEEKKQAHAEAQKRSYQKKTALQREMRQALQQEQQQD